MYSRPRETDRHTHYSQRWEAVTANSEGWGVEARADNNPVWATRLRDLLKLIDMVFSVFTMTLFSPLSNTLFEALLST